MWLDVITSWFWWDMKPDMFMSLTLTFVFVCRYTWLVSKSCRFWTYMILFIVYFTVSDMWVLALAMIYFQLPTPHIVQLRSFHQNCLCWVQDFPARALANFTRTFRGTNRQWQTRTTILANDMTCVCCFVFIYSHIFSLLCVGCIIFRLHNQFHFKL